jgi:hypothetical protein
VQKADGAGLQLAKCYVVALSATRDAYLVLAEKDFLSAQPLMPYLCRLVVIRKILERRCYYSGN